LWVDAGIELMQSVKFLFHVIERDGYLFNVSPLDHPNCKVATLTKEATFTLMDEKKETFQNVLMINAGIQGYLKGHTSNELLRDAFSAASDPNIICGPRDTHRHDQSIFSILRWRYQFRPQFWLIHEPEAGFSEPFLIYSYSEGFISSDDQIRFTKSVTPFAISTRLSHQFASKKFIKYDSHFLLYKTLTYSKSKFHNILIRFRKIF
jgi:hypothetical protein